MKMHMNIQVSINFFVSSYAWLCVCLGVYLCVCMCLCYQPPLQWTWEHSTCLSCGVDNVSIPSVLWRPGKYSYRDPWIDLASQQQVHISHNYMHTHCSYSALENTHNTPVLSPKFPMIEPPIGCLDILIQVQAPCMLCACVHLCECICAYHTCIRV